MTMQFIELIGTSRESVTKRNSALGIDARSHVEPLFEVVGVLPHGYYFKPATAKDRDAMILHLLKMEYPEADK